MNDIGTNNDHQADAIRWANLTRGGRIPTPKDHFPADVEALAHPAEQVAAEVRVIFATPNINQASS